MLQTYSIKRLTMPLERNLALWRYRKPFAFPWESVLGAFEGVLVYLLESRGELPLKRVNQRKIPVALFDLCIVHKSFFGGCLRFFATRLHWKIDEYYSSCVEIQSWISWDARRIMRACFCPLTIAHLSPKLMAKQGKAEQAPTASSSKKTDKVQTTDTETRETSPSRLL